MKKFILTSIAILLLGITCLFAQSRVISGTIIAKEDGQPIPGATIKVKNTQIGTQSNAFGKFSLTVPDGAVIIISSIGYTTQNVAVANKTVFKILMDNAAGQLNEVVVTTSLGIKHSKGELGYAVAQISPKELTQTNVTNIANGLTGKVAGLAVYTLDNGVDPKISVTLRGNRSLEGNNSALIVLDGVPIPTASLSSINPNDIADVTILKGAGAAALYGSEASNGALLITTKRGTNSGKPTIVYQNSFQFEKVAFYPKLQTTFGLNGGEGAATGYQDPITNAPLYVPYENQEYGPRYDGSTVLLGAPLDSLNGTQLKALYKAYPTSPIKAFFQTGITEQNDISFSQGDAQNSVFISAQNATRTTIVPKDKNIKNAFSLRGHRTYGIFSVDYSLGYTKTDISTYGQSYVTAFAEPSLYGAVLQLPAFLNIKAYQNPDLDYTNPSNYYDAYAINPYWIIDHTRKNTSRDILLANVNFKLDPTKWLSASYRISDNTGIGQERITQQEVDFSTYSIKDPLGASNVQSGFGTGKSPGLVADIFQYGDGSFNNSPDAGYGRIQGDALLDFHHTFFHDFKTNLLLGNTVWQQNQKFMSTGSNNLLLKDFYNINTIGGLVNASEFSQTIRQIAYYGDFNVSYRGFLTLDATLRNEQDSRLSKAERSFSYPSGKLAFIPTQAIPVLRNSKILNYWKLYGSVSRVGNIDINPYEIQNIYTLTPGFPYGSLGGLNSGTTNFSPTLKPELTTEIELGTELSFFNDRLGLNFTYYNQHDKNQTVPVATTIATGFSTSIINVGETQSKGYEIQLTGDLLTKANNKFLLRVGANFSDNDSKVISLLPGVSQLSLGNNNFAIVGQPFPVLFTSDFVRDPKGRVVVDANSGDPSKSLTLTNYGRTTPKYNLGVNLTLSYKFISLYALAEYRGGYVVDNNLGQSLDFTGAGFITAEAGRQIFVYPNSSIQTAPGVFVPNTNVTVKDGNYDFWQKSAYSDVNGAVVSSGAFWKLREVSLNFDLNQFIDKSKFIKGAMFSLTGRNLFIWVPKSNPYTDPEFSNANPFSSARGLNDDNITPGTRVFGANLKLTF